MANEPVSICDQPTNMFDTYNFKNWVNFKMNIREIRKLGEENKQNQWWANVIGQNSCKRHWNYFS